MKLNLIYFYTSSCQFKAQQHSSHLSLISSIYCGLSHDSATWTKTHHVTEFGYFLSPPVICSQISLASCREGAWRNEQRPTMTWRGGSISPESKMLFLFNPSSTPPPLFLGGCRKCFVSLIWTCNSVQILNCTLCKMSFPLVLYCQRKCITWQMCGFLAMKSFTT